ncbi:hypothetical protein ACFRI7_04595 [Streptomyces sp. NPDC056716]|uniref:hypothetical protein n=1 Tax=unclassified Streptomyces TaxID=2593676 RepID=UPI00368EDA77
MDIELPEKTTVEAIVSDATETKPLARYVDTVLRVSGADGEAFILAVEAQEKRNSKKESSWPYYVAYLQSRYELPVLLLVVCRDRATAKWAAGPFACGARGWISQRTYPLVVGPENVPVITDERTVAEKPAMAAFSALTHANSPGIEAILDATVRGASKLDREDARYFIQFLDTALSNTPAGETWRTTIMPFTNYFPGRGTLMEEVYYDGKADGRAEGRAEGKAEGQAVGMAAGEAKGVLRVLEVRGIAVSDEARERILGCADLVQVGLWLDRAGSVRSAEELLDGESGGPGGAG